MPHYEFFGPVGTACCTLLLPVLLYVLDVLSNAAGCVSLSPAYVPGWDIGTQIFSWKALTVVYGWFGLHLALHVVMPANVVAGVTEPNGIRWMYRLNALLYCVAFVLTFHLEWLPLRWAADHYLELLTAALILAFSMALALYATSFRTGIVLSESAAFGSLTYDFWMGRELNPRFFGIDWKEFCELYPGLSGWAMLNLAFAHKQLDDTGAVSLAMILVNVFQLLYVTDALFYEPAILTTMDIVSEGFGFMLTFGDLAWVPFSYCLQAKFLAEHNTELLWYEAALVTIVNVMGYVIFRGANSQKDLFRRDPSHPAVAHLETLPTDRGTKLICSGWWGIARHINYTGDWLMGLAWCGTCGLTCPIPYFYAVYFAALLIHRERRDDEACRRKYGRNWTQYCERVPYRLVPYLY